MYHHVRGTLTHSTYTTAVLEAVGVGYELHISLTTHRALPAIGKECCLLAHLSIREDAHVLYGFATDSERDMFRALISISGIGPTTALQILSAATPDELATIIAREDVNAMKSFKGIGPKTAQRVILELKGKTFLSSPVGAPGAVPPIAPAMDLATTAARALESLGIPPREAAARVDKVLAANPSVSLEDCIRTALQ